jgi:hypothetical protein
MYTEEQVRIIKVLRGDDVKWSTIAKVIQKSEATLMSWWSRNRLLVDLPPKPIISKKKTGGRVGLQIKKLVNQNPKITARDIVGELQAQFSGEKDLPKKSTINNFLIENKLVVVKLLKRPLVNERNKQKRLDFAKKHLQNVDTLIDATIWSDETTVRKAPKDKEITFRVHSSVDKEFLPFNHQIQMGGFSVMFWGCISVWGIGPLVALEGSQNQHTYCEMLKNHFIDEFNAAKEEFGIDFQFMQDNAPCHKTRKVDDFLQRNGIPTLEWPPQSPDINPIENIWNIIKARRNKKFGMPANRDELIDQIFTIWDELEIDVVESCIENMDRRLTEVIRMKGRATKY